jgi:hypothetical protein
MEWKTGGAMWHVTMYHMTGMYHMTCTSLWTDQSSSLGDMISPQRGTDNLTACSIKLERVQCPNPTWPNGDRQPCHHTVPLRRGAPPGIWRGTQDDTLTAGF